MAHLMETMFSVKEVPWHGLGKIVTEAPSAQDAIKIAGLDWKVERKPVYQVLKDGQVQAVPDFFNMTRSSDEKVLSVKTGRYTPLQNSEAFNFFNPFVDSGMAKFETAGSLKEGRVIWIMATLNKAPIEVRKGSGDIVNKYLLLSNSHDGSMAVRVGFTPVRVVCNNTLTGAINDGDSQLIRIRHSSQVAGRLDQVQDIVNAIDAKFEATAEKYDALSQTTISKKDLQKYVNVIFELRPDGTEREKTRAKMMQETIANLFENGAGQHLKSAKGTAWGMYNAVTEYLTHQAGKDSDTRLYGNWFGDLSRKNEQALEEALELVG